MKEKITFLPDEPIKNLDEDYLKRNNFAKNLAEKIINSHQSESLVIGINGPWGSGKSSFLNLLDCELQRAGKNNNSPFIIMRFNPWNFSNINQLIRMFFHEIKVSIGKTGDETLKSIGENLEKFGKFLTPLQMIPILRGMPKSVEGAGETLKSFSDIGLFELKEKINKSLHKLNKQIIILIDDIDRLDKESICLMLRLIRLNADFYNTVYVLAFDKQAVEKALGAEQGISGHKYLEKIIQVSLDLPLIDQYFIKELLSNNLNQVLTMSGFPDKDLDKDRFYYLYKAGFESFFKTIRDVKRYTNVLSLTLPMVQGEVDPADFTALEGIRIFCPDVYNNIYKVKDLLRQTSQIYGIEDFDKIKKECENLFFEEDKDHTVVIRNIFRVLFPQLTYDNNITTYGYSKQSKWRKEKRICSEDMFDKYFILGIPEGKLSEKEAQEAFQSADDRKTFTNTILKFNKKHLRKEFFSRMWDFAKEWPEENIEATICALVDAGDKIPDEKEGPLDFGPKFQINGIIYNLLKEIGNCPKRARILKKAAETGKGLCTAVLAVSALEPDEKKDEESIISVHDLKDVKRILVEKINKKAKKNTLSNIPGFSDILFCWARWENKKKPKEYVSKLVSTDKGVLKFLVEFLSKMYSSSPGMYVPRTQFAINKKLMAELVDIGKLIQKVKKIKGVETKWKTLSEQEKHAVEAFLSSSKD